MRGHGGNAGKNGVCSGRAVSVMSSCHVRRLSSVSCHVDLAKERFHLETSDLCAIVGFRQTSVRSTLTIYYVDELKAAAICNFGQSHLDNQVPAGKDLSGVAKQGHDAKAAKDAATAQAWTVHHSRTCHPRESPTAASTRCRRSSCVKRAAKRSRAVSRKSGASNVFLRAASTTWRPRPS